MHRRGLLATGAVVAASGCLDVLTGSEPAAFTAGTAIASDAALSETGFELSEIRSTETEREFSAAGQSRSVVVTSRLAEYARAISLAGQELRGAVFTAFASPAVEVVGQTFNPLADATPTEIARRAVAQYDQIGNLTRTGTTSTSMLGSQAEVGVFTADATITDGVDVTVVLRVTEAVRAGPDFVVAVGGYPELVSQEDAIRTLTGSVEHTEDVLTASE